MSPLSLNDRIFATLQQVHNLPFSSLHEHLKNQVQLRTLTNAQAQNSNPITFVTLLCEFIAIAYHCINFWVNLKFNYDPSKKRPHICIKMHFLCVYGFFWVFFLIFLGEKGKKKPPIKKTLRQVYLLREQGLLNGALW